MRPSEPQTSYIELTQYREKTKFLLPCCGVLKILSLLFHLLAESRLRELFRKRAGIEPVIGHCKSDHRLKRNYYNGPFVDSISVMLASAAFYIIRNVRGLLCLF